MNRFLLLLSLPLLATLSVGAQELRLSLDSCINMALRENKQLQMERLRSEVSTDTRKAVRTKYMPRITGVAGYLYNSEELSLLSNDQKDVISNLGTTVGGVLQAKGQQVLPQVMGTLAQVFPEFQARIQALTPAVQQAAGALATGVAQSLNQVGGGIVDAFRTDTRNNFGLGVTLTQPLFMGGQIVVGNRMASIAEEIAQLKVRKTEEEVIHNVQTTYYLVVEVEHKKQLADEYVALISKMNEDVKRMVDEGVVTRADGLKVSVRLNEAEMQQLQAQDGLVLAKMMLCKLCGLPLDSNLTLEDTERFGNAGSMDSEVASEDYGTVNRVELEMLEKAVDLYGNKVKMERAAILPQLLLTGGYLATSPSVYNGFQKKLNGAWNVGVLLKLPILDCYEAGYKMRAARNNQQIARMEQANAQEMIDLQIQQTRFKLDEAVKKHNVTIKNFDTAEENLKHANLGFSEGVMTTTDLMMAQTAWLAAKTQKIEAEIGVTTAKIALRHAYGN